MVQSISDNIHGDIIEKDTTQSCSVRENSHTLTFFFLEQE